MKKSMKVLIVVMAMLIVGLVTFIIVDKAINKNEKEENVANATNTTNENKSEKENDEEEKNEAKTIPQDGNSDKASSKIAADLKERRFMAKNNVDIESKAKFMKVGENVYLIEVVDDSNESELTTVFAVTYDKNLDNAVFDKIETTKHAYNLAVDTNNAILKATITIKGIDKTIFYDISEGKLTTKAEFMKPYDESYEDMYKYTIDSNEVSEEEFENKLNEYNKYDFKDFSESAVILNDENINKLVK